MTDAMRARAPGRVNLIGEHTDYNDGFVLPCAIPLETRVAGRARADRAVIVRSRFEQRAVLDLDGLAGPRRAMWSEYVRGMLVELRGAGVHLRGADLRVSGTLPLGGGLSSSASFEIAIALAMLALAGERMQPDELARLAQRAEGEYAGTQCGIMDQFTVLRAKAGHALFLDTRTLDFEYVPVPSECEVVICNTMVKHELAASAYNERRSECEASVEILRALVPEIRALRDVSVDDLARARDVLPPVLQARTRHVVTENERVREAAQALRENDLTRLGALLYASHESLQVDYEVSCEELDVMVRLARAFDGTIGARMTGGGFGGCTVNLIHAGRTPEFRAYIAQAYRRETGISPEIYDGTPSAGASILDE
jgi:galactokinase